ncbi:CAF17-like 4Fe-4S cluster assembly/insertion protein YgfZ [Luteolibacter soli]|uniref:Aminomethyltransferase folate-binding domain-containing protein n=1 Tax=Luteolibacter soli TaxID=3135280 RepID=A0ABU9AU63_9BACT
MKFRSLAPETRCLLAFRGPDAERYLNGQVSQDVRNLGETALPACVTDAKGKLQAFVHVFRGADGSPWVEGPAEQREELEARLGRYLIADDAEIHDISDEWQLVHVVDTIDAPSFDGGIVRHARRIGPDGFDLWLPTGSLPELEIITEGEAETRRIQSRLPKWGAELTPGMLPPEAGLDKTSICYHKGCYIGQEVLSRLKTVGKVNRRLAALLVEPDTTPGSPLELDGKPAGKLTSIAPWPNESGLHTALGYLEKSAFEAGELTLPDHGTARVLGFV